MSKWAVTLSTTEPFNYVGIIKVRQGNKGTEVMGTTIIENGVPLDLTGCRVTFQALIDNKYPVERSATITNAKSGIVQYVFDEYTMQSLHKQTANFQIYKGEDLIGSTQDFSYFVIKAVSHTPGEMGSYWQSVEDLINDMTAYINAGKGDFDAWMSARKEQFDTWMANQKDDYDTWFASIKGILASIDPGGTMLLELMDARVDVQGIRHDSISSRLIADMQYLYERLKANHYTLFVKELKDIVTLQDDNFSKNHTITKVGEVKGAEEDAALIIATIDDKKQDTFYLEKVGEI